MDLAAGMHFDVVAGSRDAVDVAHGEEVRAIGAADENLLHCRGAARDLREQAAHALLDVAAIRLCERCAYALDARRETIAVERLQ
jgi:hypothetical protein